MVEKFKFRYESFCFLYWQCNCYTYLQKNIYAAQQLQLNTVLGIPMFQLNSKTGKLH